PIERTFYGAIDHPQSAEISPRFGGDGFDGTTAPWGAPRIEANQRRFDSSCQQRHPSCYTIQAAKDGKRRLRVPGLQVAKFLLVGRAPLPGQKNGKRMNDIMKKAITIALIVVGVFGVLWVAKGWTPK